MKESKNMNEAQVNDAHLAEIDLVAKIVSLAVSNAMEALKQEMDSNVLTNHGLKEPQTLDQMVTGLPEPDFTLPDPPAPNPPRVETQNIEVSGDESPWVQKAVEYLNKQEIDDNETLKAFLGIDPAQVPWCAYFVKSVLAACGLPTLNSGRAADWAHYGQPCSNRPGAIAVFDGHVGFVTSGDKLLGGNQGDMVRYNNLGWYLSNRQVLAFRCPPGYSLV